MKPLIQEAYTGRLGALCGSALPVLGKCILHASVPQARVYYGLKVVAVDGVGACKEAQAQILLYIDHEECRHLHN
jgi:hypothetical protein